jgi:hypothetical protein
MKTLLESVELLEPDLSAQIRALVPAESLRIVQEATSLDWLPLAANVELAEAITQVLGQEKSRPFFREVLLREYRTSLFESFVTGVTRVFGITPVIFVKMVPRGWQLAYHACGVLRPLSVGEHEASLLFSELPLVCVRNPVWLEAVRSTFYTAFDLSHCSGEIEWEELNLMARRAVFRFRWDRRFSVRPDPDSEQR